MSTDSPFPLDEAHRYFAKASNGRVWELLRKEVRSSAENAEMLHAAHASFYHWLYAGTGVQHQRAEWLISHVYAVLADAPAALRHAVRCWELTHIHSSAVADFDVAYAYEALARAHVLAEHQAEAKHFLALAEQVGAAIANDEDRAIFLGDFASGHWLGWK